MVGSAAEKDGYGCQEPGQANGGPARQAEFFLPDGVTVDHTGNLVIADTFNNRIQVVAARTGTHYGQQMVAGDVYTIASGPAEGAARHTGPAVQATLEGADAVAVDATGNVLIAAGVRIQVLAVRNGTFYGQRMLAGHLYNVAGDGHAGYAGNGGPALRARLDGTEGVAVDGAGNVIIADRFNDRIRVVAGSTGTFYGQAMTAGDIYTIAGQGPGGFSGDGGPATNAEMGRPWGVAVDGAGDVLIADDLNNRIREVAG
jgi:hypothetical protein